MGASASAGVALGAQVLGTGLDVFGKIKGGKQDAAAYSYKASLDREAAQNALLAGGYAEGARQAETTRTVAEQKVGYAANGIDVASPVVAQTAATTQMVGDMDAAMIHYNAAREAFGYNAEAGLYDLAGKNAKKSSKLDALGSILSGASSLSDKWSTFKQSGALGSTSGKSSSVNWGSEPEFPLSIPGWKVQY